MSHRTPRRALLLLLGVLGALSLFSSTALAVGAPIVTVGSVDHLTLTTATAHGTVNPNGAATTYKIEYGKTKLYGQSTVTFSKSAEPYAVEAELFGLDAMNTYHYRISATNSSGTTLSSDATFETAHVDWEVEGSPVTGLPSTVKFQDNYKGNANEGGYIELSGSVLGLYGRFYCKQSSSVSGELGLEITGMTFNNGCFGSINGVVNAACKPTGITAPLTGDFAQAGTITVKSTEECPIGEKLTFKNGGFGVEPEEGEKTTYAPFITGTTWMNGEAARPWFIGYSPARVGTTSGWQLSGADAGKKFGVHVQ